MLLTLLYYIAYLKDSVSYEACRLGTACSARCFRAASLQRGSWRQPAQGKCSFPCDDWNRLKICGQSSAFRRAHDVRWTSAPRRPERKRRRPRQGATHYLQVVYSCAFILLPFSRFRGSCSYYIKVLAIPQTFLDTIADSVWIVLFLSSLLLHLISHELLHALRLY